MTLEIVPTQDDLPSIPTLEECERDIDEGMNHFVNVGRRFWQIREYKLHPQDRFEDYLKEKWGYGYANAGHKIIAAETYEDVKHIVEPHRTNEGQMRVLAQVPKEERELVYTLAYEATGGKPTASSIRSLAVALNELVSTGGYITVDDSGTQKRISKMSPEKKAAFLEAYLDRETWERQQQHIARGSLSTNLANPMVNKISLPSKQINRLINMAGCAPEEEIRAYEVEFKHKIARRNEERIKT